MVEEVDTPLSVKEKTSIPLRSVNVLQSFRRNAKQYNSSHFTKAVLFISTLELSRRRPSDDKRFAQSHRCAYEMEL